MKYNFSVYGSFWDSLMGTHWSPFDEKAQGKYRMGKVTAETSAAKKGLEGKTPDKIAGNSTAVEIETGK